MAWPRKPRPEWTVGDYDLAIIFTEEERARFRQRYGERKDAERIFAASLLELRAEQRALELRPTGALARPRETQLPLDSFDRRPGSDGPTS